MVVRKPRVEDDSEIMNPFDSKDFLAAFLVIVSISVIVFFYGSSITGQVTAEIQNQVNGFFTFILFLAIIGLYFYINSFKLPEPPKPPE